MSYCHQNKEAETPPICCKVIWRYPTFQVKKFFDDNDDSIGTGKKTVKETLAKIKSNMKWNTDNAQDVKDWFNGLP